MKTKLLMVGSLLFALSGVAYAGPSEKEMSPWLLGASQNVDVLFEHFDADKDGTISRAEAAAYFEQIQAVRIKD